MGKEIIPFDEAVKEWPEADLWAWKGREEAGYPRDERSQWYYWKSREETWGEVSSLISDVEISKHLDFFTKEDAKKIGPYSVMLPWHERVEKTGIDKFFVDRKTSLNAKAYGHALSRLRSLIPAGSLEPLTIDEAIDQLPKNTQSGLPFFRKFRSVLKKERKRAQAYLKDPWIMEPFVAGWRGQPGGPDESDVKQRLIWMGPKVDGIIGAAYMQPIMRLLRERDEFAAWSGLDRVGVAFGNMFRIHDGTKFSTDFEAYDSTLAADILWDVFDVIGSWYGEDVSSELSPLGGLAKSLILGPLLTPEGLFTNRAGGLASGSGGTQTVGTLANSLHALYVSEVLSLDLVFCTFLGDDAVTAYHPVPPVQEMVSVVRDFGLEQNADKQYLAKDAVHYLASVWDADFSTGDRIHGQRPISRAVNGMLSYKRFRGEEWTPSDAAVRTIMQMVNTEENPAYDSWFDYWRSGDRNLERPPRKLFSAAGGTQGIEESMGLAA